MKNFREEHGNLEYNLERKVKNMSVTVKDALVLTPAVVNVTKKLDGNFPLLGGLDIGENSFVFAARRAKSNTDKYHHLYGKISKMPISGGTMSESALHVLEHGNDIAYYNGNYYVAMGNGLDNNDEKRIAQFPSNLMKCIHFTFNSQSGILDGLEPLQYISKICYYSGIRFIAGNGLHLAMCKLNEAGYAFDETGRFDLEDNKSVLVRSDYPKRAGQSIFYANHKIYNIFSYKESNGEYICNDIAVYRVSEYRNTLCTSLETVYRCDVTTVFGEEKMNLFEIEGITALNGTDFYIAVNQRDEADNACDAIYRVNLT